MIGKKIVVVSLVIFCLSISLLMVKPTISQSIREYDPWYDINDDGKIDIKDVYGIALKYGTTGEPINKTQIILDLQNRVSALEEQQNYVRTLRLYTPNETMTEDLVWKDAGIFAWTPQNATNNAILQCDWYFQYVTPDPANYQLVFRILINDFEFNQNSVVNYTTEYQQSQIFGVLSAWCLLKPNQSTYTVKFQIRCAANYSNPIYVKDINILLRLMDGLPPS